MTMRVTAAGEVIMLMSAYTFIIMDGITGIMVDFMDGAGTMLAMEDFMETDGVNLGDGTDGIDGTIGATVVLA